MLWRCGTWFFQPDTFIDAFRERLGTVFGPFFECFCETDLGGVGGSSKVLQADQHGKGAFQLPVEMHLVARQPLQLVGGTAYLLAPVSKTVLDALATVGAETEDATPDPTEDDGNGADYIAAA